MNTYVLIVDDDPDLIVTMSDALKLKGFEPFGAPTGSAALNEIEEIEFAVALIDLRLDSHDISGLEVLSAIKKRHPETECILLTGHASQDSAIQAVQMDAFGYYEKPFDMEQVLLAVQRAAEKRRAARALRESEAQYRAVIHSATDAIISADSMGNIIGWNPSAEKMFGYTEAEALSQPLVMLLPKRYHAGHLAGMARVLEGGEKHVIGKTAEMEGLRKDNSEFPLEVSLAELQVAEEKIFTAIIRDITERKWAEGMQKKYSRILAKRIKELNCMYSISELVRRDDMSQGDILLESAYLLSQAYQFPEVTVCRLSLDGQIYVTEKFRETAWLQSQPITVNGKQAGTLDVYYLEEKPQEDEGPFLVEERTIIKTVADIVGKFVEQR